MTSPGQSSRRHSILIVEDDYLIGMDLRDQLSDAGYTVIGRAVSVDTALALLDLQLPDACVLDVNLRGVHSDAVARML